MVSVSLEQAKDKRRVPERCQDLCGETVKFVQIDDSKTKTVGVQTVKVTMRYGKGGPPWRVHGQTRGEGQDTPNCELVSEEQAAVEFQAVDEQAWMVEEEDGRACQATMGP